MKQIFLILSFFSFYAITIAQVQQGGSPYSSIYSISQNTKNTIAFPLVDLDQLATEDAIFDLQKDIPYRFGYNFETEFTTQNSGEWTNLANGDRIWRLSFYSEGAQTLNFLLENYVLAEGASLFFYNENYNTVLGSFTNKNNREHKNLSTMPIPGEKITLEFYEPASQKNISTFKITRVTHGYRSIKVPTKGIGTSGGCNNNVICAVGDNWREQIRSVGIIIVNGNGNCTGALVNNTCEDKKPYFLTADHCVGGSVTSWSIGFNWESATCGSNSGYQNISLESINVLALRASNSGSDFALVELTQTPPTSYNVFFAGWDKSGITPTRQVGIHHPDGDLKKISFDNDPAATAMWYGAATWHIFNWEDGTTEGGSSGSPLFDQNNRIIGQLYGGTASCSNNIDDYYGRFDISWNGGSNASNQLISWLDPCSLNPDFIDGLDGSVILENDVAINFINKPEIGNCGVNIPQAILITNNGTNDVTSVSFEYGLTGALQTYNWSGTLTNGQSETISFDKLYMCVGSYDYTLNILSSNLTLDQNIGNDSDNFSFDLINGSKLDVVLQTNYASSENSFEIYNTDDELMFSENSFSDITEHTFSYCLPIGDYYFKIKDTGGNGLTPTFTFDIGYYSLKINNIELINNAAFGSEEITNFSALGNGLSADFLFQDSYVNTNISVVINHSGLASSVLWEAPDANTTSGNSTVFNTSFPSIGTYPISLTITNDTACDVTSKDIIITKNTTGIHSLNDVFNASIYPNPVNKVLNIETYNYLQTNLSIIDNLGKILYSSQMNESNKIINLEKYARGLYFIVLENKENKSIYKFIKD